MSTPFAQTIATDHRVVYELRDLFIASSGQPDKQLAIAMELMWNIARHTTTEQVLVHPLCVKYLGNEPGGKLAEFDDLEHQKVKTNLLSLLEMIYEGTRPGSSQFDNLLETTLGELHRHNDSEEASDIPTLERAMSAQEAAEVAQMFEAAKEFFIPKNFHSGAGSSPTPDALHAALTAPLNEVGPKMKAFLEGQA